MFLSCRHYTTSLLKSLPCVNSQWIGQALRPASSWVRRRRKQKEREETVVQYAGRHAKRADRLYVWGYAATGALGVPKFLDPRTPGATRIQQHIPHHLALPGYDGVKVHEAACGYGYTVLLCIKEKKHFVLGAGINTDSQLGFHKADGHPLDYVIDFSVVNLPLANEDTRLEKVACGRAHTVIYTNKEGVFTLGHNGYGQCGRSIVDGEEFRGSQVINKIDFQHKIEQVVCGQDHTLLLTDEGKIYSFGLGSDGQTGLGHYHLTEKPTLVEGDISGETIVQISSKGDCVLAVSDKGDVFGWGNNEYNQLAVVEQDQTQLSSPRHLPFSDTGKVIKVAAAGATCALLNDEGDVFVWGYGILGKGPSVQESCRPTRLPSTLFGRNELQPDSTVVDISCGLNDFAAITNSGDLYMWGKNKTGCLGLGHANDQYFPFKVLVPAEVRQVRQGVDHTLVFAKGFS